MPYHQLGLLSLLEQSEESELSAKDPGLSEAVSGSTSSDTVLSQDQLDEVQLFGIWKCTECSRILSHKSKLETHVKNVHRGLKFPCDGCDKKFSSKGALQMHTKRGHKGEKLFVCDRCAKSFGTKHNMQFHMEGCVERQAGKTAQKAAKKAERKAKKGGQKSWEKSHEDCCVNLWSFITFLNVFEHLKQICFLNINSDIWW